MTNSPFVVPGRQIVSSGRTFVAVQVEPYTRRSDGAASVLVTWRGRCATCEAAFHVKGSRAAKHLPVNCPAHRGRQARRRPRDADAVRALRRLARAAMSAMRQGKHQDAYGHLEAALLLTGRSVKR
jgi:hypothetical protein